MARPRYVPQHADTPDYATQIERATTTDQLRMIAEAIEADNTMTVPEKATLFDKGRARWRQLVTSAAGDLGDRAPCRMCGDIIECLPDGLPICKKCGDEATE